MAVAMNPSGYFRSDFMISDAAIPMRMEELQQEQAVEFAEILGDFDKTVDVSDAVVSDAPVSVLTGAKDSGTAAFSYPDDEKALALMIYRGDVKLEDLPDELITPKLLMELAKLQKFPPEDPDEEDKECAKDKDPLEDNAAEQNAYNSDPAVLILATISDDKTAELSEITAESEAEFLADDLTVTPNSAKQTAQPENANNRIAEQADALTDNIPVSANAEQPRADGTQIPEARSDVPQDAQAAAQTPASELTQSGAQQESPFTAEQTEALNRAAKNGELSQPVVKTAASEPKAQTEQPETNERAKSAAEQFAEKELVKSANQPEAAEQPMINERVKSAAEEFAMLKSARTRTAQTEQATVGTEEELAKGEAKPTGTAAKPIAAEEKPLVQPRFAGEAKSDGGQNMSGREEQSQTVPQAERTAQPLFSDTPVVFAKESGETVEVRPGDIISQATEKLVETAKQASEGETEYSMVLNPEELGRITVRMTKAADGAISVTIAAENAHTQRILEQNSGIMQDNLRSSGIQLESWQTVQESRQEAYAEDYNGSSKNPYYREEQPADDDEQQDGSTFAELIASM